MALETIDYGIIRLLSGLTVATGADPAAGTILAGTVNLSPVAPNDVVPQDLYWVITALTTTITGPGLGASLGNIPLTVYDLDPTATTGPVAISKTIDGVLDVNDTCRLIVPGGQSVFFEWTNVPVGVRCAVRFQYELVSKTGAAATRPVMY